MIKALSAAHPDIVSVTDFHTWHNKDCSQLLLTMSPSRKSIWKQSLYDNTVVTPIPYSFHNVNNLISNKYVKHSNDKSLYGLCWNSQNQFHRTECVYVVHSYGLFSHDKWSRYLTLRRWHNKLVILGKQIQFNLLSWKNLLKIIFDPWPFRPFTYTNVKWQIKYSIYRQHINM